ncbi:RHS repeat-associated core domain-containing protein [Chryseobacterium sp. SC28]|nr:RHS repeat-associated core domain-containing protein [Chryseobacterium sp. SC28]
METIQYFDGLGRPKQVLNVKASPLGNDVVTPIIYDGFGRQVQDYVPLPQSGSSNGAIYQQNPQSDPPVSNPIYPTLYPSETIFYSKKVLEASPLDRIQQQVQVGNAWSSKPVTFGYETNTAIEVKKFVTTTTWPNNATSSVLSQTTNYGAAQLYKNTVTDEDGNTSIEFKNGEGQTLLVKKNDGTKDSDTYYVYNEYNQLAFVIQPEAAAKTILSQTDLDELCYQYRYDGRNRLVEKKIPGKGWEYMVYDKADRLILSQDANLRLQDKWLFTKYDTFGRVIYTGTIPGGDRLSMQNQINNLVITESPDSTGFGKSGITVYYTNGYFTSIDSILSVNYYDTYPTGTPPIPASILSQPVLAQTGNLSTKSLPTASFVKNIEDDKWTKNYTFYDQKGRPIGAYSYNHLGGFTKSESLLDFTGVPQKTMTYHSRNNPNVITATIEENFTYDNQNRLTKHTHKVNTDAPVTLAKNKYNEIGQLTEKEVGGDQNGNNPLQIVNYKYNIRGWLTGINSGDIAYNAADESYVLNNGKLFGYNIRYNDPENPSLGAARYNGNIAETDWISRDVSLKRYGYQYDRLNRLLRGNYQDPGTTLPESHLNDEILTYDLNGNIKTLNRFTKGKVTANQIDGLVYHYANSDGSNRLISIDDTKNNISGYEGGGQEMTYDANGNTTAMPDKKISAITYNFLNLPKQINQNANVTNYYYRADGVKVKKKFVLTNSSGTKIINTEYLDGFQYSTPNTEPIRSSLEEPDDTTIAVASAGEQEAFSADMDRAIIVAPGDTQADNMILSFFPTAEGFYDYENKRYIYQYKDHLGNVRVSYVKSSAGDLEIRDRNDYYPFGMSFLKNDGNVSVYDPMAIPYNYKYNGKELQETGMYDYGARFYMPDIGRWNTIDKLSEKYFSTSTYTYVLNRPTVAVDPDGKRVYFIGGAGNDQDGWNYINRWAIAFAQNGITDFWRVNASAGKNADVAFTANFRNTGYEQVMRSPNSGYMIGGLAPSMVATNEQRPVQDDMIDATVSMYQQQLKDNPLKEGEQFNLVGYSYGSVLQAQSALRLADSGQVIDNLVLIGSPISDKSDLMKQLQGNKNIKNVTRYDLKGDLISNPKDILQFLKGGKDAIVQGDDAHHFDAARPGNQADKLMQTIVQWLQQQGVKN